MMGQLWIKGTQKGAASKVIVQDDLTNEIHDLPWRTDLINHSPTGLEWGTWGTGQMQLALAILVEAIPEGYVAHEALENQLKAGGWYEGRAKNPKEALALFLHHRFKGEVVARLEGPWSFSLIEINEWIAKTIKEMDLCDDKA